MSDELKPCPFCGGEASMQRFNASTMPARIICQCGIELRAVKGQSVEGIVEQWNTRAAVTDEQFAMAVHDGEAWQKVRTCRKVPGKMHYGARRPKCSECGYGLGDSRWAFCPNCGAKVVR